MKLIAGVDIGNSTTEVCLGEIRDGDSLRFLSSSACDTTGTKGTIVNIHGIKTALTKALTKCQKTVSDISVIRLNEAAPVIGDTTMETLTETIITDSSLIGHNPSTPAGAGQAVGILISIESLGQAKTNIPYILVVPKEYHYETVANIVNQLMPLLNITGMILQADEAVLVYNRLKIKIPIIDEVNYIKKVPDGELAAIEVALEGQSIRMLSNPYGIATLLELNAEETRKITPIAKGLLGKRSAVVIKTPNGNMKENVLPAGEIYIKGDKSLCVHLDEGAEGIMQKVLDAGDIIDISGQYATNIGDMLSKVKENISSLSGESRADVRIADILAVDTLAPVLISGALAGETCLEKAVGIAAMVKTQRLPMEKIAKALEQELGVPTVVAGVEAVMAGLGALTTPGTELPIAILDMGGGSTDAAVIHKDGSIAMTHQAGAGELVSLLIQTELGLKDRHVAEQIKKYPLAKVESLFHMRMENGQMCFKESAIDPRFYGRVVLITEKGLVRIEEDIPMEKIVAVRREAKQKVFVVNAFRALRKVAPDYNLKKISNIVLVGGSAEDFEIPEMLMEAFAGKGIVCGRGNIRGVEGPRNAVATGLVLTYMGE